MIDDFRETRLRAERQPGFTSQQVDFCIEQLQSWQGSRQGSSGAAERAQIQLDHKGPNIHWGPRYCQHICPILFAFDSNFRGYVLGSTDLLVANSVQRRNKINSANQILNATNDTVVETHWMTRFILFRTSCQQAKRRQFTITLGKIVTGMYHLLLNLRKWNNLSIVLF